MKTKRKLVFLIACLLLMLFGSIIFILFFRKSVHAIEVINNFGNKIEIVLVWANEKSCLPYVLRDGESIIFRHEISAEGSTRVFFTIPETDQWYFQSGEDYFCPGMSTDVKIIIDKKSSPVLSLSAHVQAVSDTLKTQNATPKPEQTSE